MRIATTLLSACLVITPHAFAAAPVIQSVINAASYQPLIASAAWVAITGQNLASSTRQWAGGDFIASNLPTSLDDVKVTINGKPAFVYFISPVQINVLAPDDPIAGVVPVQVTTSQGTSNIVNANKQVTAPALFNYAQAGGRYAVVQAAATYDLVAPPGTFGPVVRTKLAAPGEGLVLYATGLGPVVSGQSTGQLVSAPSPTATPVKVSIGGVTAAVQFAGLVASGLYQINVVVPPLPSGDAPLVVSVNGTSSTGQAFVPIQAFPGPLGGQTTPQLVGCVTGRVDSITYSVGELSLGQADEVAIGGTLLCPTCAVKQPLYPEFVAKMERSMGTKKNVRACYDSKGTVFQVSLLRP